MTDPNDGVPDATVISHAEVIRRGRDAWRLRQAAQRLDELSKDLSDGHSLSRQDASTAWLLGAIADVGQWRTAWDVRRAALTLANVILGGSDE